MRDAIVRWVIVSKSRCDAEETSMRYKRELLINRVRSLGCGEAFPRFCLGLPTRRRGTFDRVSIFGNAVLGVEEMPDRWLRFV
jgi:hypothetical protein